jgi:hypothetical protein
VTDLLAFPDDASPLAKTYRRAIESVRRVPETDATFDPRAWSPEIVDEARSVWRARASAEYASSTVFAQLAVQVVEANAPMDATGVILRMAQEEVRHAELSGEILRALGEEPRVPALGRVRRLSAHEGATPAERALRNIVYGCCMSEVVNTARFVDTLDAMEDPFLRSATRQLLADEIGHGQFGFLYLEACRPWLDAAAAVRASTASWLRFAFARIENEMSGARIASRDPARVAEALALGLPDRERYVETFRTTMEHAVVPGLERFGIDAGTAWRERAKEAR